MLLCSCRFVLSQYSLAFAVHLSVFGETMSSTSDSFFQKSIFWLFAHSLSLYLLLCVTK